MSGANHLAPPVIRSARDEDADGLIDLIGSVFAEYPGCVLDVDGEMPDLRAIATAYAALGGRFWVAETPGRIVGCIGCRPAPEDQGMLELMRLYVHTSARRMGLGARLTQLVEDEAARCDSRGVVLWSDTRFIDAHRLYGRLGYDQQPVTRELHDASDTVEFSFRKHLSDSHSGSRPPV